MNQKYKYDKGKIRMGLIPPILFEAVGEVLTYGAAKYSDHSWRNVEKERYIDALMRHWTEYLKDNKSVDEESNLPHLWHVACNVTFLLDMESV